VLFGALLLAPLTATAQAPLGGNFLINTFTTGDQAHPSLASDAAGNFVVVWHSLNESEAAYSVVARRYDAAGQAVDASGFRVNVVTAGSHSSPGVAADPDGRMVVVWHSTGQDGSGHGVFARRYEASGTPAGVEFRVNTHTAGDQNDAAVAKDAAGNFVVAWTSRDQDGDGQGVFARRYDAAGTPLGAEFRVNAHTSGDQADAAVASDADGNFVVVWTSAGQDGDGMGIFGRRFDAGGVPLGDEFRVNGHTTAHQAGPTLASRADGRFVVAWASAGQDGSGQGVFARRYAADGSAQPGEFRVNAYVTGFQGLPSVAADEDGFVVTWTSERPDDPQAGVRARRFDWFGAPTSSEFRVNTFTTGYQMYSVVQALPEGRFIVSWISYGQDGSAWGVYAQRFAADVIFADGFESGDLSAWSSAATGGGDLTVAAEAALGSTAAGLRGVVDDTAALYVQDDSPEDEPRYRARFHFDPNGFDPGEALGRFRLRLFVGFEEQPTRRVFAVVLRRMGGSYALLGRARLDDDAQAQTGFLPVTDGPHFVEIDWVRSSGPDANDGSFALWIDGNPVSALPGLDNSRSTLDFVRLGALSVKAGAAGTVYWDEFESRRTSDIGP
jgi:hypothetical protein